MFSYSKWVSISNYFKWDISSDVTSVNILASSIKWSCDVQITLWKGNWKVKNLYYDKDLDVPHLHLKVITCNFHQVQPKQQHASLGKLELHQNFLDGTEISELVMGIYVMEHIHQTIHPIQLQCYLLKHLELYDHSWTS